jgi:hypothetical protein
VDLEPKLYDELQRWIATAGTELPWRVPAARVVRALLRRMLDDDEWQRAAIEELRVIGPVQERTRRR